VKEKGWHFLRNGRREMRDGRNMKEDAAEHRV